MVARPALVERKRCRRHPDPITGTADVDPVAIVMRHVAEWLIGHPGVVSMVLRPSSRSKRLIIGSDARGSPEMPIFTLVADALPVSVCVQNMSFIVQPFGQIFDGLTLDSDLLLPLPVQGIVPGKPFGINLPLTRCRPRTVRDERGGTGFKRIAALCCLLNKVDGALEGRHLDGFIPDIEIEHRKTISHRIPERRRNPDHAPFTIVHEPGHPGCDIHGGELLVESDHLDLRVAADSDPHPVGH